MTKHFVSISTTLPSVVMDLWKVIDVVRCCNKDLRDIIEKGLLESPDGVVLVSKGSYAVARPCDCELCEQDAEYEVCHGTEVTN